MKQLLRTEIEIDAPAKRVWELLSPTSLRTLSGTLLSAASVASPPPGSASKHESNLPAGGV